MQKERSELSNLKLQFESEFKRKQDELDKRKKEIEKLLQKEKDQSIEIRHLQDEIERLQKFKAIQPSNKESNIQNIELLDDEMIDGFEKVEEIGYGAGGKVYKVIKKVIYALKEMNIKNANITHFKHFIHEYEIMNLLQHPNILKTFGILMSSSKNRPSILLEYCSMNLQTAIENRRFKKEEIPFVIYQIAEGMKYVHFKKIIHRDLKPTNILVDEDGTIKICDFGISKLMTVEEQSLTQGVGTQKFMAPEILREEEYNEKVDVYSFGVVLFYILSKGQMPKISIIDIGNGKMAPIPSSFTNFSKKLIKDCWNSDSKNRPSFKEIIDRMTTNNFQLVELNATEVKNVQFLVSQHKSKIPKYDE